MYDSKPIKSVFIWANIHKRTLPPVFEDLLGIFKETSIDYYIEKSACDILDIPNCKAIDVLAGEAIPSSIQMVLSLGGDGTVIAACRNFSPMGIPILGVNLGQLGFLTEIDPGEIDKELPKLLAGHYSIEERMMLETDINGKRYTSMNEFVLMKGNTPRFIKIRVEVGGEFVAEIFADGLITATPTGSTAYSMSLGGSIIAPGLPGIIITPMAPHMLTFRPFVVRADDQIRIFFESVEKKNRITFIADGQDTVELKSSGVVTIRRSDVPARLVKFHDRSFYRILYEKFGWGAIPGKMNPPRNGQK